MIQWFLGTSVEKNKFSMRVNKSYDEFKQLHHTIVLANCVENLPELPKLQSYDYINYDKTEFEILPEMQEYLSKILQKEKLLNMLSLI